MAARDGNTFTDATSRGGNLEGSASMRAGPPPTPLLLNSPTRHRTNVRTRTGHTRTALSAQNGPWDSTHHTWSHNAPQAPHLRSPLGYHRTPIRTREAHSTRSLLFTSAAQMSPIEYSPPLPHYLTSLPPATCQSVPSCCADSCSASHVADGPVRPAPICPAQGDA